MSTDLAERLLSWAQNEEMIDVHYTGHGLDCISAHDELKRLRTQIEAMKSYIHKAHERDGAEIERLRSLAEAKDLLLSEWLGEEKAQSEIERLHELLEVCMARWIPFAEVEFRRRVKEALRYE